MPSRRKRLRLARYNETNPTTETYVLAGIGAALFVGLAYWLFSQFQENAAFTSSMVVSPTLPASASTSAIPEEGSNVQTLGPGGSTQALPATGSTSSPSVAGAPIQSPYYPPVGGVSPGADQLINALPSI